MRVPLALSLLLAVGLTVQAAPGLLDVHVGGRHDGRHGAQQGGQRPDQSSTPDRGTPTSPRARIQIGEIVGVQTQLPNARSPVNKFLGVPFAVSPPERFSAPQPARNLAQPLLTQEWKPACIQQFKYPVLAAILAQGVYATPPSAESEDCLYLNVYAPASNGTGRAVFVWIPAGEMEFGSAGQPPYDGSAFAAYHDIIVVSAGFRTNVFGFPSSPQLPGELGNLGLLDQRLALQWVQDNIAAFGGDPRKVTVGGVSSGSWNSEILMYTYAAEQAPFRAIIAESGNAVYLPYPIQPGPAGWNNLTAALDCADAPDQISCMRTKPASDIRDAIDRNSLSFYVQLDGASAPRSAYQVVKSNNFVHVPILTGTSAQEGRYYAFGQTDPEAFLANAGRSNPAIRQNEAAILAAYPVGGDEYRSGYEALSAMLTDFLYTCPAALLTNDWARQGVPVWQYVYNASFSNTGFAYNSGVYHASEVRMVFQTYNGGPINPVERPRGLIATQVAPTEGERGMAEFVNGAWARFIQDPEGGPGWVQVHDARGASSVVAALGVAGNGSAGATMVNRKGLTAHCGLFLDSYSLASPGVPQLSAGDYA